MNRTLQQIESQPNPAEGLLNPAAAHPEEPAPPSIWVSRWAARLPEGANVLDFAGGSGRNLPPLLARGARVTIADRDAQALERAVERARHIEREGPSACERKVGGVCVRDGAAASLACVVADLEHAPWPFAGRRFDAIVVCNFLFRPRADLLAALLAPGGLLIHETFAEGNARYGRPSNPDFLLRPGELAHACERAGLVVLAYEHGHVARPKPAIIQRVCAVRPPFDPERVSLDL